MNSPWHPMKNRPWLCHDCAQPLRWTDSKRALDATSRWAWTPPGAELGFGRKCAKHINIWIYEKVWSKCVCVEMSILGKWWWSTNGFWFQRSQDWRPDITRDQIHHQNFLSVCMHPYISVCLDRILLISLSLYRIILQNIIHIICCLSVVQCCIQLSVMNWSSVVESVGNSRSGSHLGGSISKVGILGQVRVLRNDLHLGVAIIYVLTNHQEANCWVTICYNTTKV